jgi:hypothetical protein
MSKKYNGCANYQTWNVKLWIANDERLYNLASDCSDYADFVETMRQIGSMETADDVAWNDSSIDMGELKEFWDENFDAVEA